MGLLSKDKEDAPSGSITPEQLQQLMAAMAGAMAPVVAEAVKAAREPNEFEREELDKKHKLRDRMALAMKQQGEIETERVNRLRSGCPHKKEDGRHAWVTQVNSVSASFTPMCCLCAYQTTPIPATQEQLVNGVNLNVGQNQHLALSVDVLEKWAESAWRGKKPSEVPKELRARYAIEAA